MIGRLLGRRAILSEREQDLRRPRAGAARPARRRARTLRQRRGRRRSPPLPRGARAARRAVPARRGRRVQLGQVELHQRAARASGCCPEGVTPTTDRINLLRYGAEASEQLVEAFLLERTYPADVLRELTIVDTPGTNAIIRRHEELTRDFIPRADLVLFVTSADRPFTESERGFLEQIREWGKKIVFVVNKIDILTPPEERTQVHRVRARSTPPRCWARRRASSPCRRGRRRRPARTARSSAGRRAASTRWTPYLVRTLDQEERIRLKLLNPLNVGLRLAARYKDVAFERLKLLAQDIETIQNIDRQLALFARRDGARRRAPPGAARRAAGRHGAAGVPVLRGDPPDRPHPDPDGQRGRAACLRAGGHRRHAPPSSRPRPGASSTGSSSGTSRPGRT